MKISELLKEKATISFEVFPPKNKEGDISSIYHTIGELKKLNPDFISVTYGAGGSSKGKTVEIASAIKNQYQIESVAHLSCITSTKEDVLTECRALKEHHVDNILALRGDYPAGEEEKYREKEMEFHYASELNQFIKENFGDTFCLSGACYPEIHQEADCFQDDLQALKKKVDAGAEYLITQIFFDNNYYYSSDPCRDHASDQRQIPSPDSKAVRMFHPVPAVNYDRDLLQLPGGHERDRDQLCGPPDHRSDHKRRGWYSYLYNEQAGDCAENFRQYSYGLKRAEP